MPPLYKKKFGKPMKITSSQPTAKKSFIKPIKSSTQTNLEESRGNPSFEYLLKKSAITPEQINFKANIPTESASFEIKLNDKETKLDELCMNEFYNTNQTRITKSSVHKNAFKTSKLVGVKRKSQRIIKSNDADALINSDSVDSGFGKSNPNSFKALKKKKALSQNLSKSKIVEVKRRSLRIIKSNEALNSSDVVDSGFEHSKPNRFKAIITPNENNTLLQHSSKSNIVEEKRRSLRIIKSNDALNGSDLVDSGFKHSKPNRFKAIITSQENNTLLQNASKSKIVELKRRSLRIIKSNEALNSLALFESDFENSSSKVISPKKSLENKSPRQNKTPTNIKSPKVIQSPRQPKSKVVKSPGQNKTPTKIKSPKVFQSPRQPKSKVTKVINVSNDSEKSIETSSQISIISSTLSQSQQYKDALHTYLSQFDVSLNQPSPDFTKKERLEWLQEQRNVGLFAQCDNCDKWRYLPEVMDPLDLPEFWYCRLNEDQEYNKCSVPERETTPQEDEDCIYNEYNAGSIVWVKIHGFPWWPAMVDDDPDDECYYWLEGHSDVPTLYHVVFFDSIEVSRAWVKPQKIVGFKNNLENKKYNLLRKHQKLLIRYETAKKQAQDALKLTILQRLRKYSFISRWTKPILKPTIHVEDDDDCVIMNKERKNKSKNNTNMVEKRKSNVKENTPKSKKTKSQENSIEIVEDSLEMFQNDFDSASCTSLSQISFKSTTFDL